MSDEAYCVSEFNTDDVLHSLSHKAKDILQNKGFVFKIYHRYKSELYGLSRHHVSYLRSLNDVSVVSSSQQSFLSSRKHGRVSKSPEPTNQSPSTPMKKNSNISTLQRKHLPSDDVDNEVSQSVPKSSEKQSTLVKIIRSATEPESLTQENTSLISTDKGVSQTVSTNQRKQLTPVEVNQNATEPENFSSKCLPPVQKEINNAEPVNLESNAPHRLQTVIVSPKKIDGEILNSTTEVGGEYANPISQDHKTVGRPEVDKQKPEKADETVQMSSIFSTAEVKENLSSFKEIGVDGGKNTRSKEKATASENQKSFNPTKETTQIIQASKGEKKDFSPVKKAKISSNPDMKSQKSVHSDNKDNMLVHSYQDSKKNITLNQGSCLLKNCERKSKSPSSRTDIAQCSSKSRIIHSSGAVEIETDISFVSTQNPSPETSPIALLDYKSDKTIIDNIDKRKSPKNTTLSGNESKPGISRDISLSPKGSMASSPPILANTNSPNLMNNILLKNCERKRKSTCPWTDAAQCSSKPRIIYSSGEVEIETDISFISKQNPSPKTSPSSLIEYKSDKMIIDNIDKGKSPKDITFSGKESKPEFSRDVSLSAKGSITSSPPIVANTISPVKDDEINLGKDSLSYIPSNMSLPKNCSPATLSSPRSNNFYSKMLIYCITQLKTLLSMREEYLLHIFKCLLNFRQHLEYLYDYLQVIVHIVHKISFINADYVSEELQMNILRLLAVISELVKKLGSSKAEIVIDIQYWIIYFQQIRKIISENEPLMSDDKPLVTMENLYAYEEDIKTVWKKLDDMFKIADSRRSLLLSTEHDFQKSINMFLECLITVGILKPCSPQSFK